MKSYIQKNIYHSFASTVLSWGTLHEKLTRYVEIGPEKCVFHTLIYMTLTPCLRNEETNFIGS